MRTITASLLASFAGHALAQCPLMNVVEPGNPEANQNAATSVAAVPDYVLLGAPGTTRNGFAGAGDVCTFYHQFGINWSISAYLRPADPAAGAAFGRSLGSDSAHTWAVVGAPGLSNNAGAAYIFNRDPQAFAWTQTLKLDPNFTAGDTLGASVAMNSDGTIAAVAAPNRGIGQTTYAGSVLVYTRSGNTWSYETALYQDNPSIRHNSDYYGTSVAADGDTVLVGVPWGDVGGMFNNGYIHIWTRAAGPAWSTVGYQYPGDAQPNDHFGFAVAMSGDIMAISSPDATVAGQPNNGAVYILRHQPWGWALDQKITPTDGISGLYFGWSVAVSGDRVVVGTAPISQRTYIFRSTPNGWLQDARYKNPNGNSDDHFGAAVAIDGENVFGAAPNYSRGPVWTQAGRAWYIQAPTEGTDTFAAARAIAPGVYHGCTDNCTIDGSTTCGNGQLQGPDVWYRFVAPASGVLLADTQGSDLDTILSIHSATGLVGNGANTLICNDDFAFPATWSRVSLPVTAGQSYVIRIAGYAGATGAYTLNLGMLIGNCYANCDGSTTAPILNVADFSCFLNKFAAADPYVNCDGSTTPPVLNVADFACFLNAFAAGCT